MISEYKLKNLEVGEIKGIEHSINLTDQKIINLAPYRIPPNIYRLVNEEIEYLKNHKIIRESKSKYSFPAFPIVKQNGRIRLVVDYRRLNQITEKTQYVFPKLSDILTSLHKSKIFSKVNLNMGYYQIPWKKLLYNTQHSL